MTAISSELQPHAIVTGLESMQGLQAVRILAGEGIPVIAVARDKKHYCCRTNKCERIVIADSDLSAALEELGPTLPAKAVLFPGTDEDVLLVSRNRQALSRWYHIALPDLDVVELMMDKLKFYAFARQAGFSIPTTCFLSSREDLEAAVAKVRFPCVLKPHFRDDRWNRHSAVKAFLVADPEELAALYEEHQPSTECLILQDWIEGPDANLYSFNGYFAADSTPLVTFIARKLRQWPPVMGQSSLGEECRNELVLSESLRLFRQVGFRGLAYLELKRDERSGDYYIVEPNIGRPTGRSAIAEAGGVALLYTMYCDLLGRTLPANRQQAYRGVKWIHLRRDLQSALYYRRRGQLTWRQWWRSVKGRKAFAIWAWDDMGPFWGDWLRAIRLFLRKSERRKRDPGQQFGASTKGGSH
jgi:predicted ATP-grasp superfamily ATP-dependent carboligase